MVDGEIDIYGTLVKTSNDTSYTGEFSKGVFIGNGHYKSGPYEFNGQFENGKPVVYPNQIAYKNLKVEEPEDPKAKKAPQKKGKDEEEEDPNPNKLKFQVGKDVQNFEI